MEAAMSVRRILIVANETVMSENIDAFVLGSMLEGSVHFTLVVPVAPPRGTWTWTETQSYRLAADRPSLQP
jgi:hypothetical protein